MQFELGGKSGFGCVKVVEAMDANVHVILYTANTFTGKLWKLTVRNVGATLDGLT